MRDIVRQFVLFSALLLNGGFSIAQTSNLPASAPIASATDSQLAAPSCAAPAEAFDMDDYDGPFNQLIARFTQKVEIKTVHPPHRHSGIKLCSLDTGDKFHLFMKNSF